MMTELDRRLSGDVVTPSPRFTSSVMRAVRDEQASKPIPFPWTRALPGIIALLASLAVCIGLLIRGLPAPPTVSINATFAGPATFGGLPLYAISWVLVALLLTLFSVALSMRIRGVRAERSQ
jgi:hypothetical protein